MLPELCWLCHVSALGLALAVLMRWSALAAVACLLQFALAIPAYLIYLLQGGHSHWTSVGVHLLAPLLGAFVWWRQPWPAATTWLGVGVCLVLCLLSWRFTPASLNINLAAHPAMLVSAWGEWGNRGLNWWVLLALLWVWQWMWNNWFSHSKIS